ELQKYDHAIAALQVAIALSPNRAEGHLALGNVFAKAHREEDALAAYSKAIELSPALTQAHEEYNSVASTMRRPDLYLKSYARAREKVGGQPDLLLAEAERRLRLDEAPIAEKLLYQAKSIAPERADIENAFGRSLVKQGRLAEGIDHLKAALDRDPSAAN